MTKEIYNKSVDKLLDAYNAGELFHGNCQKCAVGNLLGTGIWVDDFCTISTDEGKRAHQTIYDTENRNSFCTDMDEIIKPVNERDYTPEEKERVDTIINNLYKENGFTKQELATIEYTFEKSICDTKEGYYYYATRRTADEYPERLVKGQLIGLTAVLKVMEGMVEEEVESGQERLEEIYNRKMAEVC